MAQTYKFGNGTWARKKGSTLAYSDTNNAFKPLPFSYTRDSIATRVNKEGLIEVVGKDQPRIDYTDSADGVLLLEPSRTNSLVQSNKFDTTWTLSNISVLGNQTGVGGSVDAWKLNANSGSGEKKIYVGASSGTQSLSVYAKKGTRDYLYLRGVTGNFNKRVFFNLSNGLIETNESVSAEIFNMGNGWYRCNAVFNQDGGYEFQIGIAENDNAPSYTDDGTGNIYIQYAQAEVGSYPTSYIPTSGSTVPRAAETANGSGNSEVFNDSEGVLFLNINTSDTSAVPVISLSNGSVSNEIEFAYYGTNQWNFILRVSGGTPNVIGTVNASDFSKFSVSYTATDFKVYLNGFLIGSNTLPSPLSGLNTLDFNFPSGSNPFYGKTKEIGYYDTALTDEELEYMTSYRSLNELVTELNLNTL